MVTDVATGEFVIQLVLQLGALGLLTVLIVYAPRHAAKVLERWDKERKNMMQALEAQRKDFKSEIQAERVMCAEQFDRIFAGMEKNRQESELARRSAVEEIKQEVRRFFADQHRMGERKSDGDQA